MATKREVLEAALRGEGCLGKAADDEPVFVLVAHDCISDEAITHWVILARAMGVNNNKVQMARQASEEMLHWHTRKIPD
jgi:hypothetical protein